MVKELKDTTQKEKRQGKLEERGKGGKQTRIN